MPELPEVEAVRRALLPVVTGQTIVDVQVCSKRAVRRHADPQEFVERLVGQTIGDVRRRGKYLILPLGVSVGRKTGAGGEPDMDVLCVHLRMTGRLVWTQSEAPVAPFTRVLFALDDAARMLFIDMRHLGEAFVVTSAELPTVTERLGPEPLSPEFTPAVLAQALENRSAKIKAALLAQEVTAGVGNIYADEALFLAGIHPNREASSLRPSEIERLWRALRQVLQDAIQAETSWFYGTATQPGMAGAFDRLMLVYHRTREPCRTCGTAIQRLRVSGRSTHFCPTCQPE